MDLEHARRCHYGWILRRRNGNSQCFIMLQYLSFAILFVMEAQVSKAIIEKQRRMQCNPAAVEKPE